MLSIQIRKGNSLLKQKDYEASLKEYQIVDLNSPHTEMFLEVVLISLKGYNHFCLLQYEQAEKFYNEALIKQPYDSTTLMRRATLYMRTRHYQKAAKDIFKLSEVQPESVRVAALLIELKQKSIQSFKQQKQKDPFRIIQSEEIDLDQQEALNFSNVKQIDRSFVRTPNMGRKSQINFKEDQRIQYDEFETKQNQNQKIVKQNIQQKLQFQQLQLNSMHSDEAKQFKVIEKKNTKKPKKSILKCSIAYRLPDNAQQKDSAILPPPIDVLKIKDIDGKTIQSSRSIRFSVIKDPSVMSPKLGSKPRKSCIKNISVMVNAGSKLQSKVQNSHQRFSFGQLRNADGKVLQKRISSKQHSSGDESDEYNIFGNKDPKQLNEQLRRIKSYVQPQENQQTQCLKSFKQKKSILKPKNFSVLMKSKSEISTPKKSVIFK